jgi:Protein of unknown function (DUF1566)/TIR domain
MPKPNIFINYRRSDTEGFAIALYGDLNQKYPGQIFMDRMTLEVGRKYESDIERSLHDCGILIVLIGPNWLSVQNKDGHPRLFDTKDILRTEIAVALKRNIPVIPLLVGHVPMPSRADLPPEIVELAEYNATHLYADDWPSSITRLCRTIDARLAESAAEAEAKTKSAPQIPSDPIPTPPPATISLAAPPKPIAPINPPPAPTKSEIPPLVETRATPVPQKVEPPKTNPSRRETPQPVRSKSTRGAGVLSQLPPRKRLLIQFLLTALPIVCITVYATFKRWPSSSGKSPSVQTAKPPQAHITLSPLNQLPSSIAPAKPATAQPSSQSDWLDGATINSGHTNSNASPSSQNKSSVVTHTISKDEPFQKALADALTPKPSAKAPPLGQRTFELTDTWTDPSTGLTWAVNDSNKSKSIDILHTLTRVSWAQFLLATSYNSPSYGGYNDWRIPTKQELETICGSSSARLTYQQKFPPSPSFLYWTSTTDPLAVVMNCKTGKTGGIGVNEDLGHSSEPTTIPALRPVRGHMR